MSLILIIDDDRQLCLSFSKILKLEGHETATAFSGKEGLTQAKLLHPDLIILDIRLPDISGIDLFANGLSAIRSIVPLN